MNIKKHMGMMSADGRVRWAVDLAQLDLVNLREGDLLNLKDDLKIFIGGSSDGWTDTPEALRDGTYFADDEEFKSVNIQFFLELQKSLSGFFPGEYLHGKSVGGPVTVQYSMAVSKSKTGGKMAIIYSGDLKSLFFHRLIQSLRDGDISRIRRCPVCQRIFYKVGRKAYCSLECTYKAMKKKQE